MGRALRVVVLAPIAAAIGAVACVETLPHLTCSIADVQALPSDQFPAASSADCTSCLETPCCDAIGNCDDKCRAKVKAAHACMLATGAHGEARSEHDCLKDNGVTDDIAAHNAYQCMHDTCGETCALPVCKVDRSYSLIVNGDCDDCMAGSCCAELNACAADRGCKLITDCIITTCMSLFGPDTRTLGAEVAQAFSSAACTGPGPNPDELPACVKQCLLDIAPSEGGIANTDDPAHSSSCIGLKIVACGVSSGCSARCGPPDAGRD